MSGWVLSVTAVVCLTVLLDIIMPDGQMKKYVKGIVSIIVIFVIVTPLASLAVGKFDLTKGNITIDSDMLASLESTSDRYREIQLESMLSEDGITADVKIVRKVSKTVAEFLDIDDSDVGVEVSDGS